MGADEIHIADKGTILRNVFKDGTTVVDISTATLKELHFRKPITGNTATAAGVFSSDGSDGVLNYTVPTSGFFDEVGVWNMQGVVVLTAGKWSSDVKKFTVFPNLI